MNFLIQTIDNEIRHDFSFTLIESIRYQNWLGNKMTYDLVDINTSAKCNYKFIPVGSVDFVSDFLISNYGHTPKPKNVPEELFEYTGRDIFNTGARCIESEMGLRGMEEGFVKSNDEIKGYTGAIHSEDIVPDGNYQVSSLIDIESEYRCFVFKGELVGVQHYSGDFRVFPDLRSVDMMVTSYKSAPVAYTLDVAVTKDGVTVVIEVHDFFSCGLYGFSNLKILPFMFSQWFYEFIKQQ